MGYELYYPEWLISNIGQLTCNFKQFNNDIYLDLLSGKALPWCNIQTQYSYKFSIYYDFISGGQNNRVRFDISLGCDLYELGALHTDILFLIGN